MHRYQAKILRTLRWAEARRFSELMQPTGLTSDSFKYYLRKLQRLGFVEKGADGLYRLTSRGKEHANELDERQLERQKQPKVSVVAIVRRSKQDGATEYLFQERLRQPYLHYWGLISGPVLWGQSVEDTAAHELYKQTGLMATFRQAGVCRVRDYAVDDNSLLEDKFFFLMLGDDAPIEPQNTWGGGQSCWLTVPELHAKPHYFDNTVDYIRLAESEAAFASFNRQYDRSEY